MADKSFGVKDINLIGASGTPEIESPNNLNIKAVNVAISTDMSVGGNATFSGNIGIGTDNPAYQLSIYGTGAVRNEIVCTDSNAAGAGIYLKTLSGGSTVSNSTIATNSSGSLLFWTGTSGASERLRIDSSGQFAFGRTGQITGNGNQSTSVFEQLSNNNYPLALHSAQTNNRGLMIFYATTGIGNAGDPFIVCTDNTSNKFLVSSNGSATFATYDDSSSSGFGVKLNVAANSGDVRSQCQSTASQYTQMYGGYFGSIRTFHVLANGNVQNTNNSYSQISDVKLKENIVDANSQWDDLKSVQVRNFNFKAETGHSTHTQIGVVAQEIEAVSPGLVYETPDQNNEGEDLGTVTKAVNYSVLYMKSVKALQEAMTRIETLEAKVAALEG